MAISPAGRADRPSVCMLCCLPSMLLVSCTPAAMGVQVYTCSMLVAHRPYEEGRGPFYWATVLADTWLKTSELLYLARWSVSAKQCRPML